MKRRQRRKRKRRKNKREENNTKDINQEWTKKENLGTVLISSRKVSLILKFIGPLCDTLSHSICLMDTLEWETVGEPRLGSGCRCLLFFGEFPSPINTCWGNRELWQPQRTYRKGLPFILQGQVWATSSIPFCLIRTLPWWHWIYLP